MGGQVVPGIFERVTKPAQPCAARIVLIAWLWSCQAAFAGPPALCEDAAAQAAQQSGVPIAVLRAIALAESGRNHGGALRPWPWTLNEGGRGSWFETADAALAHLRAALASGRSNIDIGCFQINHRWHSDRFFSLEAMLDPRSNALYAAGFLAQLYRESGDWSIAAGAYHSRTPEHATRYRGRFDTLLASLTDMPPAEPPRRPATALRNNLFPLLQGGGGGTGGSLVPAGAATGPRLLSPARGALFGEG